MGALELGFAPFIHFVHWLRDGCDARPAVVAARRRYCLWLVHAGSTRFRRGDRQVVLMPGGAALLQPASGWRPEVPAGAIACELVFDLVATARCRSRQGNQAFRATDGRMQPAWAHMFGTELDPFLTSVQSAHARQAVAAIDRLWWQDDHGHLLANLELARFLLLLASAQPAPRAADPISRAEAWARDHLARGATVAGMARIAGRSRAAFARAYAAQRERPPGDWLASLRWSVAHQHLAAGSSLAAAARAAGWRKGETLRRRMRGCS